MGFREDFKTMVLTAIKGHDNPTAFAKACGIDSASMSKFLNGKQAGVGFENVAKVFDYLGVSAKMDRSATKEVCFVAPKRLSVENRDAPIPEDYIAVPLAEGEVAAGRGMIPQDEIQSWVLVWKNHDAVRFRTNLIAVEIGKGQNSMVPTLHPQDILLVDRDDFRDRFTPPGNIFLVREPDSSVTVKRVTVKPRNGDMMITYYSDNAVEHPPMSWSLTEDYDGDIAKAIIGRVVWAWSDMSRK